MVGSGDGNGLGSGKFGPVIRLIRRERTAKDSTTFHEIFKKRMVDVKSRLQCAGLNLHEVEDERALRERSSDPLGLESCAATARDTAKRRQRIGGVGIQLRKDATRTPTSL